MVTWLTSPGLTPYPDALAAMDARVAEVAAGTGDEAIWLLDGAIPDVRLPLRVLGVGDLQAIGRDLE